MEAKPLSMAGRLTPGTLGPRLQMVQKTLQPGFLIVKSRGQRFAKPQVFTHYRLYSSAKA
jgi:hypothetical protein